MLTDQDDEHSTLYFPQVIDEDSQLDKDMSFTQSVKAMSTQEL